MRKYEEIEKDLKKLNGDRILRLVKLVEDSKPKKWGVFFDSDTECTTPIDGIVFEFEAVAIYYINILQMEYPEFKLVLREVK